MKVIATAFNDKDTTFGNGINIAGANYEVHRFYEEDGILKLFARALRVYVLACAVACACACACAAYACACACTCAFACVCRRNSYK